MLTLSRMTRWFRVHVLRLEFIALLGQSSGPFWTRRGSFINYYARKVIFGKKRAQ